MIEVQRVQAQPGGWVNLKFTDAGYTAEPVKPPGMLERLIAQLERWFGAKAMLIAIGLAIVLAIPPLVFMPGNYPDDTIVLACVPGLLCLLYFLLGSLFRVVGNLVGMAVFAAVLFVLVLLSPLLLISRRFRRWALPRWFGEPAGKEPPGSIPAAQLVQGWVSQRGNLRTVAVRFPGGAVVGYTASGSDGVELHQGFQTLLGERLSEPAAGGRVRPRP